MLTNGENMFYIFQMFSDEIYFMKNMQNIKMVEVG